MKSCLKQIPLPFFADREEKKGKQTVFFHNLLKLIWYMCTSKPNFKIQLFITGTLG